MKVLIELDTNDPYHQQLLGELLNHKTNDSGPVAEAVAPPVVTETPEPAKPTQQQLKEAFAAAFAADQDRTNTVSQQAFQAFGPQFETWTAEQANQTITELQSIARF